MFFCCPLKKYFRNTIRVATVSIQIRSYVLSGLIWFLTICKSYQQTALVGKELKHCFHGEIYEIMNAILA